MKKLLVCILALILISSAALAESETACYPLGDYDVYLPAEWSTTYNSHTSILSCHQMKNRNYDHVLTAILMNNAGPITSDALYNALCDLITDEFDITVRLDEDMEIEGDRVYLWSGFRQTTEAAGAIYCHGKDVLIVVHASYGLDEQERLDYERALVEQITIAE